MLKTTDDMLIRLIFGFEGFLNWICVSLEQILGQGRSGFPDDLKGYDAKNKSTPPLIPSFA
jgi:hypothetical protein